MSARAPRARILMLHGHGGDRHEARIAGTDAAMFDGVAAALAQRGFATLRPNLAGLRVAPQVDQAEALLRDAPADAPFCALGFSQGGLVALELSARLPLAALALLNPVLDPGFAFREFYRGAACPDPDFMAEITRYAPRERLRAFAAPVFVALGEKDALRPPDAPTPDGRSVSIRRHDADHLFDAGRGARVIAALSGQLADFFDRNISVGS